MFQKKIVAIGGGDIRYRGTRTIDEEIIRLSGKKKPNLLFIPTASSDHGEYCRHIEKYFGRILGCTTDVLYLLGKKLSTEEIEKKILGADIIYVGGGNTLMMMKLWRKLGVDILLEKAWRKGIVLCGISAGSICWFESGHSDSMSFYNPKKWSYINVRGLGFIKGIHCPHFNSRTLGIPRKKDFQTMMNRKSGMGIAIDDNCAIAFINVTFRVISSKAYAKAYRVYRKRGEVISERIPEVEKLQKVSLLYARKK